MTNMYVTVYKKTNGYLVSDNRNLLNSENVFTDQYETLEHVAKQLGIVGCGCSLAEWIQEQNEAI